MIPKRLFIVLGFFSLALGFIGIFLPVLPTTPFVLLAAFFFSKGSERWHQWLLANPTFGPMIRDWEDGGVIRTPAKAVATLFILSSFSWLTFFTRAPLVGKLILDGIGVAVLVFIWSRPSVKVEPKKEQQSWPGT